VTRPHRYINLQEESNIKKDEKTKREKKVAYSLFPVVVARIVRKKNFYVYFTVLYMPLNNILLTYHQFELFQKKIKNMKKLY